MRVHRQLIASLPLCYAIQSYDSDRGRRVLCAAQGPAGCIGFSAHGGDVERVWSEPGGTMSIVPLGGERFLATNNFFTGFIAEKSAIFHVERRPDGTFHSEQYLALPYLHRFCLVSAGGRPWIVASSLCDAKNGRDDWSHPGRVYVAPFTQPEPATPFREILGGIHRNHGMYHGPFADGSEAVIVSGVEGAFVIRPPAEPEGEWSPERLFDFEISDIMPYDVDGDGVEEIATIEGFHGDRLNIYKRAAAGYERIYSYPVAWGHALWCGDIFGRRSILIGYNSANAALVLLQARDGAGGFSMEAIQIDELQAYNNIDVWDDGEVVRIYAACRSDRVMMYTLEP